MLIVSYRMLIVSYLCCLGDAALRCGPCGGGQHWPAGSWRLRPGRRRSLCPPADGLPCWGANRGDGPTLPRHTDAWRTCLLG